MGGTIREQGLPDPTRQLSSQRLLWCAQGLPMFKPDGVPVLRRGLGDRLTLEPRSYLQWHRSQFSPIESHWVYVTWGQASCSVIFDQHKTNSMLVDILFCFGIFGFFGLLPICFEFYFCLDVLKEREKWYKVECVERYGGSHRSSERETWSKYIVCKNALSI